MNKKVVANAFSPGKMIKAPQYTTRTVNITEEEFIDKSKDAISHIGNVGIANRYGLKYNRTPITLLPGDEIYVVNINGGKLPYSGIIPDGVYLTFQHVEVEA